MAGEHRGAEPQRPTWAFRRHYPFGGTQTGRRAQQKYAAQATANCGLRQRDVDAAQPYPDECKQQPVSYEALGCGKGPAHGNNPGGQAKDHRCQHHLIRGRDCHPGGPS